MNPRELVILLLGLAIVAVVVRGLYVALQARRGQIRLAIDKNIPKDVDLEALELVELPGGGARVVRRDNPAEERLSQAEARARAMDLGDDEDVPVLMDAVQIRAPAVDESASEEADEVIEDSEEDYLDDTASENVIEEEEENPDDVLMDYGDDDMSSVAPDYEPEARDDDSAADDDFDDEDDYAEDDDADEDYPDAKYDDEYYDDEDEAAEFDDEPVEQRQEPSLGNLNEDADEFSMTAGERIGFEGQKKPAPAKQSSLFDEDMEGESDAGPRKANKRKSLFAAFGRKKAEKTVPAKPEEPRTRARPEPVPEYDDLEPEEYEAPANAPVEPLARRAEPEAVAEEVTPAASDYHSDPSEVLVISVMAKGGREFRGDDILHTLITAGLKFGDMNIFHARLGKDNNSPVIFSVANILNPGTFDLNAMDSFTTVGISFFLALPSPINNLDAFEKMMATAEQIRHSLDGELKDDNRNGMTAQTIEHYRQRVRDFELRKLKAAGGRG